MVVSAIPTDPQRRRLFVTQRSRTKTQLKDLGMGAALAERWLAAWEGSSNMDAERHSVDFWERGGRWAASAWQAGQTPPTIEP
jgi:hypothetical protein